MKKLYKLYLMLACAAVLLSACGQANSAAEGEEETTSALTFQDYYDLGVRYLSEGNYEEAIIAFTAAIEIDPKQASAYVGRGDAYLCLGEETDSLTAAQADYETAIALDETYVEAYLGLANVCLWMGDYDAAQRILQLGLEKTGSDVSIEDALNGLNSKVESVNFERVLSDTESADITGIDASGNVVWRYTTGAYEQTELWRTEEIGVWEKYYLFVEDGAVVALDADTGKVLWRNREFQGSFVEPAGCYIDENGTIYLCGYYGPDFFAVDIDGNTLCRIASFDSDCYWASSIQAVDDTILAVELCGGPDGYRDRGEGYIFYVEKDSFTYF